MGTRTFELTRADGTPLTVVAWYPATGANAAKAPYFTEAERQLTIPALARTFGWPTTMLDDFGALQTNAGLNAPIAQGRFPLVIFSHGFLMYPRQNSALMERLAANGHVVLSVAHPGDAADLPSSRGPLPTIHAEVAPDPDPKAAEAFWNAPNREAQNKLLPSFWRSPRVRHMVDRLAVWREDLDIVADAMTGPRQPAGMLSLAKAVRPGGFAYAGMSFGGSASVSACVHDIRCRAAINFDGIEFDEALYDRDAGKPVLLIQSDWHVYPNAGPPGRDFTSYDLAYERRATAGRNPHIHRFRLAGIRHLGMSDLILAPRDKHRDALLGTIDGARANEAINAMSLAFLERYLSGRRVSLSDVATRHPALVRHRAAVSAPLP